MKIKIIVLFALILCMLSGCGHSDSDILSGQEKPEEIFESINKNIVGEENKLQLVYRKNAYPVWHNETHGEVSLEEIRWYEEHNSKEGIKLQLLYSTCEEDATGAEDTLKGILKTLDGGNVDAVIDKLGIRDNNDIECEYGDYVIQKISLANIIFRDEKIDQYRLPITAVRIFNKKAKESQSSSGNIPQGSMEEYRKELKGNYSLSELSKYINCYLLGYDDEPSHLELFKFVQ